MPEVRYTCSICGVLDSKEEQNRHGVREEYIEMLPDPSPHPLDRWYLSAKTVDFN